MVRLFEPFKELHSIKGKTPGRQRDAALVFIVRTNLKASIAGYCVVVSTLKCGRVRRMAAPSEDNGVVITQKKKIENTQ